MRRRARSAASSPTGTCCITTKGSRKTERTSAPSRRSSLEVELDAKLDLARGAVRRGLDLTERARCDGQRRESERRVVQQVADVGPKLQVVAFRKVNVLGEPHIDVQEAWPAEVVAAGVREIAGHGRAKLRRLVGGEVGDEAAGGVGENLAHVARAAAAI